VNARNQKFLESLSSMTRFVVGVVSGTILVTGMIGSTAQAQTILNGPATLSIFNGAVADRLTVAYTVTDNSGLYTYDYNVSNPSTDSSGTVASFEVGFNAGASTVVPGSITGGLSGSLIPGSGIEWVAVVTPGNNSGLLAFESYDPPTFANANANGTTPGPWASSNPEGQPVPVPSVLTVTPEPTTTSLLALGLLFVPFRFANFKKTAKTIEKY
jgi:hypothetical protein